MSRLLGPATLADAVVVLHLAYVAFVVLLVPLILVGRFAGWSWVRNFWLRLVHFVMMAVVAAEAVCGVECPLTTWEDALKAEAGILYDEERTFVGRWANEILFVDVSEGAITAIYLLFTLLIVLTLVLVPPRRPGAPA